ncbi:MAG TPA: dihydroorotate dehydrogenase [Firmicutes bacterium]|nr:dihydroorotate dehydrogenase [Bacillota bacterium]
MACGVGACLGCACITREGPRRVCKDGPVFYACDLVNVGGYTFGEGASRAAGSTAISGEYLPGALRGSRGARPAGLSTEVTHPSLEVRIGSMVMKNPVMVSSGTFGFGEEYAELFDVSRLGAIVAKGITLLPRGGNPPPRIAETPSGMLNAIGLQNPGLDRFISEHLPRMSAFGVPVIVNVAGESLEEFKIILSRLDKEESVAGIELNVSCPNVASGGMAFGRDPGIVYDLTRMARRTTCRALIVKLSPNVTDIAAIARAAEMGGADAVSLINTLAGCAIDVENQSFRLSNITGGLSGPAIRPVAVRMVGDVFRAVNIPVIGMGGIVTWQDALEFILAGATAVSVGMGSFVRPTCAVDVADGIRRYMAARGILSVEEMVGLAWRKSQIQRA